MNPEIYALSLIEWQLFASFTFKSEKLADAVRIKMFFALMREQADNFGVHFKETIWCLRREDGRVSAARSLAAARAAAAPAAPGPSSAGGRDGGDSSAGSGLEARESGGAARDNGREDTREAAFEAVMRRGAEVLRGEGFAASMNPQVRDWRDGGGGQAEGERMVASFQRAKNCVFHVPLRIAVFFGERELMRRGHAMGMVSLGLFQKGLRKLEDHYF